MGLDVKWHDISVTHRMHIKSEKNEYDPIYCKFLNRSLAKKVLLRRHSCLRRVNRSTGLNLWVRENLTLKRRIIRDRAQTELASFQYKWVKDGCVFVRKDQRSRIIKLISENQLE